MRESPNSSIWRKSSTHLQGDVVVTHPARAVCSVSLCVELWAQACRAEGDEELSGFFFPGSERQVCFSWIPSHRPATHTAPLRQQWHC